MDLETGRVIERIIIVLCVPLLVIVGYKLFVLGVTGKMEVTARMSELSAKVTSVAPGGLCFLLAVSLGAYALFSKLTLTDTTQTSSSQSSQSNPNVSGQGPNIPASQPPAVDTNGRQKETQSQTPLVVISKENSKHTQTVSDLGPLPIGAVQPLSLRLRVAVDDLFFCDEGENDISSDKCRSEFNKKFQRLPIPDDIAAIEAAEAKMRSSQVSVQKQGEEDYAKLSRRFEK